MFDHKARIENGYCVECGAQLQEGYRYDEMFHYPLAWEHNDPKLYALHFWLVACYVIQHPSMYTQEAYAHLIDLFKQAYDEEWKTKITKNCKYIYVSWEINSSVEDSCYLNELMLMLVLI